MLEAPRGWLAGGAEPLGSAMYAGPDVEALVTSSLGIDPKFQILPGVEHLGGLGGLLSARFSP